MNPDQTLFEALLARAPYSMAQEEKTALYQRELSRLTRFHQAACPDYGQVLGGLAHQTDVDQSADQQPFLPVRMFKEFALQSVADADIHKTMTSSGTSGQQVSRIFLDKGTAARQTKVLGKIVTDLIGPKRLPMLVIDAKETIKNRHNFSARGAGILGFSLFGRDVTFALDADMQPNLQRIEAFAEQYTGREKFIFGFTSIIFQHFIQPLLAAKLKRDLAGSILLHGGGWKKLEDQAVDNLRYKSMLREAAEITRVHNYYGMVEQTGSIFTECDEGHLHCSLFSDIIVRDQHFSPAPMGNKGLVQLLSLLPESYPGHSILSEDIGAILGEDDCRCGRLGKYFHIYGRAKQAEVRGCSDTYAA